MYVLLHTVLSPRSFIHNLSSLEALWKHFYKEKNVILIKSKHMTTYKNQDEINLFSRQWSCYKITFSQKNKQTNKKATIGNLLSTDRKGFFSDFKHPAVMWALSQKCSSEQHLNPAVPRRKDRYRFLSLPPVFL